MTCQETLVAGLEYGPSFFRAFTSIVKYAAIYRQNNLLFYTMLSHSSLCDSFFILYMLTAAARHIKSIAIRSHIFAIVVWDFHISEITLCLAITIPVVIMASLCNLSQLVKLASVYIICAVLGNYT